MAKTSRSPTGLIDRGENRLPKGKVGGGPGHPEKLIPGCLRDEVVWFATRPSPCIPPCIPPRNRVEGIEDLHVGPSDMTRQDEDRSTECHWPALSQVPTSALIKHDWLAPPPARNVRGGARLKCIG